MKVFAVINQKGGTGKTTLSMNLAARLAELGKKVLLADIDPQGNATSGSGVDKRYLSAGTYEMLQGEAASRLLIYSIANRYWLLGANAQLAGAEIELPQMNDWQIVLRRALSPLVEEFDCVLMDCPPALGVLTMNALAAAQGVLIPMQCEYFAMEGLSDLADTVRRLRDSWNPSLCIAGVVRSIVDERNILARDISDELQKHFGRHLFSAAIARNVRVAEAPSHGQPVLYYAPNSKGAAGYRRLGDEFLERFL